jgi:hypothetical protein
MCSRDPISTLPGVLIFTFPSSALVCYTSLMHCEQVRIRALVRWQCVLSHTNAQVSVLLIPGLVATTAYSLCALRALLYGAKQHSRGLQAHSTDMQAEGLLQTHLLLHTE